MNYLKDLIRRELFEGLLPLKPANYTSEIIAGILMAAIFIPEVMGYARIAGMPIISGIYTILLPMAVFAIFCSSKHTIVGADSATAAIIYGVLITVAVPESQDYMALASLVAILCGIFLIIARFFRLGFIGDFLSRTSLVGFLTGVGIQVAISQLGGIFGIKSVGINTIPSIINFLQNLSSIHSYTLILSIIVLATILITRHISPKIPGALFAVVGTIIASLLFDFSRIGISLIGTIPNTIPSFMIPNLDVLNLYTLFTATVACLTVILAQSAATSRAYSIKFSEEVDDNKDILGLGLANLFAGLNSSFVVNGSPTKTQIAVDSGARSQMATLITAATVLLVVIFFTKPLSFLPNATLSSIVFLIGLEMVDISGLKDILHKAPSEFYLALITLLTVLFAGVLWGIIVTISISILLHLSHSYRPNNSILTINEKGRWTFTPVRPGEYTKKGLILYRFNRDLYYANSYKLMKEVLMLIKTSKYPVQWFILDSGGFSAIDYTSLQMLYELKNRLDELKIVFGLTTVLPSLMKQFRNSGFIDVLGEENLYKNVNDALQAFENNNNSAT
ncbi:MAG: SulP family inorganic anion transporter [Methanobacteriaceae archaeon]|nr:SulP family inorganic anion transporter [Methanobacteriaceae archaeon]